MSIRYNFNANQFVHQIKSAHVKIPVLKIRIQQMYSSIVNFLKNLWNNLCCCLKFSKRVIEKVPLEKPEWLAHVMKDSITKRSARLDGFYTPELMPITHYFNLVRSNEGHNDPSITHALTNLDPHTTPMVSNNYALIDRGYHRLAFENAIVIQEVMIFEGAHSMPYFDLYLNKNTVDDNAADPAYANNSASTSSAPYIANMPHSPTARINSVNASDVNQDTFIDNIPDAEVSGFGILLTTNDSEECSICNDLLTKTQTSCCHARICFDCFSHDIVAKTKQDFNNWISRNQMIACLDCSSPFQLRKHEEDLLSDAAKNILAYFHQQYSISLYSQHSDGFAVCCQDEDCQKAYLIEEDNIFFQCNNISSHSDQRIRLYHISCGLLWQLDHDCPAIEKNKIRDSIAVVKLLISHVDSIRRCPSVNAAEPCNILINKDDGCNHMTCPSCHAQFCWFCEKDWATHGSSFYDCTDPDEANRVKDKRLSELRKELEALQQAYNLT